MTQTQEHADAEQPSPWAPLHNPIYRNLFIASFVSNIGTWMQSVAAQWFLVEKHSSDVIVALVQTASLGPTLLFALFAGVLADLFDRRRLLIVLQTYAVLVALALAVLTYLDRVSPTALLMFTVAIGCASALAAPAWQAIQPEVVPREQIPAVSTLGSVSGNASRAIGPAIGGVVLALAGPAAVFAINAISYAGIIVALLVWKRPRQIAPLEREHFGQAIVTGLLFVNNAPIFRRILLHAALFLFPASALLALLPVVAARNWHLGASGYGVAVAAVGLGAVLAVAVAGVIRLKLSDNLQLAASAAAYGLAIAGRRVASVRCGVTFPGDRGDGLADHADHVERGSPADVAALGSGPRVVGVSVGRHRISGDRRVCLGCPRHAGGTRRRAARVGGRAGRCCPQRCRAAIAAGHRQDKRRGFPCVADTDAHV